MRRLVIGVALALASCSGAASPVPTTVPVTLPPLATTTTSALIPVQLQSCASPPITFSALCEIYELLQDWYVDQPVDPGHLTNMAITALDLDLSDLGTERRPRSVLCAVPDREFERLCTRIAEVVAETGVAMGPLMDRVVATMVEAAYGPFTYYLNPEQVTAFRGNGLVGGIGVLLDATDAVGSKCARLGPACPLRVVFVLEGNPGHEAGIESGDVIVAIDGMPVEGHGFAATAARIAGDETGSVAITIERGETQIDLTIDRAELVVPGVVFDIPMPGIGYLRIPDFEDDIPSLVAEALEELSGSYSTLVVDLRDNPGGYVFAAEAVASEFIPAGPIFHEAYSDGTETVDSYGPGGLATSGRLVVLVNEGTASAAEILAGALRDRRDAVVVGASTFGKDAIQIRFDLRNGGRVDVVVARWTTPRGDTVANRGLVPDVELELTDDMSLTEIVQEALEAAR